MDVSVLWDIESRAKIAGHEAAGRMAFYLAREAISYLTRAFIEATDISDYLEDVLDGSPQTKPRSSMSAMQKKHV